MSSNNKEKPESDKKKKSKSRLNIKIFGGGNSKKRDNEKKISEEFKSQDGSYKKTQPNDAGEQKPTKEVKEVEDVAKEQKPTKEVKEVEDVAKDETDSESDTSEEAVAVPPPTFRPGRRRRSLSACADIQDTRIKIKSKEEDVQEEEENDDQLSPLPCSPTRSCIRGRSATIGYSGEDVVSESRPRSVSFSPETVDPPPRNMKYRAWIEARSKPPPINVKHEKHKQKMNQLKKVNMSDYLASRKPASGAGIMASSTSAFGGGGMMM
ncbi:uncharacterized protein LOC119743448 isoform X2 [Patiria miniata]|uniref:Uncharacterized protein n=1 Tax=Patiria miniata TaxID=46514 RepID=A0A914BI60_PATMI|nr:uncharacterized protein LOC119743448 isoform X2 [Patiria miniata]